ncbi:hypothetical protein J2Z75_005188 [Rhizobium herbae]|uniref:Uncharacterized protein n=1 Tax=Rhizobium herbae TaxID=508661 RepID=A0ABS4EUN6_9HYPH|nr:hypothetical protein [Rhizobium herbae]
MCGFYFPTLIEAVSSKIEHPVLTQRLHVGRGGGASKPGGHCQIDQKSVASPPIFPGYLRSGETELLVGITLIDLAGGGKTGVQRTPRFFLPISFTRLVLGPEEALLTTVWTTVIKQS